MTTFSELGLCDELLQAVEEQGYEHPMPVQEQVIPHLLQNEGDLVALAQTGTGKTAAYGLPLLHILWQFIRRGGQPGVPRALILSPTRELCLQIADDLEGFAKFMPDVRVLAVYGGANIEPQIRALKKGVDVIVATPGRLIDLMRRGAAQLQSVHNLVLDEADEMLSMGFQEDLDAILEGMDGEHNTLLFSATMSKEIERIANNYLHEAHTIQVGSRNEGSENVNHIYYMVQAKDKYAALKRVVDFYPRIYAIIFCRTRMETQQVADNLIRDGYNADALHGELSQQQRDLTMQKFRQHRTQLLVATDVAARGLDVDDLTHVINYGMPDDTENYTHRSGRTGRAGKKGTSISIVHVRELHRIKLVEKVIQKEFVRGTLPEPRDICGKQLYHVIDQIERVEVDEEEIAPFMPEVTKRLEWLDKEDLIKRVVSREFGRFLQYYANAPEIEDVKPGKGNKEERGGKRKKGDRTPETGYTRLFCPVSKMDGFYAKELIKLVNDHVRGGKVDIGRIDLMKNFSFIEVNEQDAERVIDGLCGVKVHGRRITVEVADAEGGGTQERKAEKTHGSRRDAREERGKKRDDFNKKRDDFGKKSKKKGDNRSDIEDDMPRGRQYKKEDWMKFLHPEKNKDLQGAEPDFSEEGWARRYPKKKKK